METTPQELKQEERIEEILELVPNEIDKRTVKAMINEILELERELTLLEEDPN